jgi:hypothetical protein
VLQLEAPAEVLAELKPVNLGASSGLMVGQKVFAIGGWMGGPMGGQGNVRVIVATYAMGRADRQEVLKCCCTRTHHFLPPATHPPPLKCIHAGNPFGLDHTLTSGIISGLNRELSTGGHGWETLGLPQSWWKRGGSCMLAGCAKPGHGMAGSWHVSRFHCAAGMYMRACKP